MKRLIIALLVGGAVFGTVYGLAATLDVGFSTAATGSGTVGSCGDVTGSTFILEGQANTITGPDTVAGAGSNGVSDITQFYAVNIETVAGCDQINAFVEVRNSGGFVIASGNCEINAGGTIPGPGGPGTGPNGGVDNDGLGFNESSTADNVAGCTAIMATDTAADDALPSVAAATGLLVTMT